MRTSVTRVAGLAASSALILAGCVTDVASVLHDSFPYNGQTVEIIRETFTLGTSGPQTRYYVYSNFVRYGCDGTVPDCRRTFERAQTYPEATRL